MEENTLASELARVQSMVRELEANMDRHGDMPSAAREICDELACRVDRSLRIARSWSADGSPRDDGTSGNAANKHDAHFKRRKGVPSVRSQVRVTSVKDTAALDDGFSWRKYGQKDILGAKYPRAYFRCTHRNTQNCFATKQVQRADGDPLLFDVVYHGAHTCVQAAHHNADQQPVGHDQSSPPSMGGFEPVTPLPFEFAPTPAEGGYQTALLSPTSSYLERQIRSGHAAATGFGGMEELEHHFQEFFSNPPESFQWEDFQDIFAAN